MGAPKSIARPGHGRVGARKSSVSVLIAIASVLIAIVGVQASMVCVPVALASVLVAMASVLVTMVGARFAMVETLFVSDSCGYRKCRRAFREFPRPHRECRSPEVNCQCTDRPCRCKNDAGRWAPLDCQGTNCMCQRSDRDCQRPNPASSSSLSPATEKSPATLVANQRSHPICDMRRRVESVISRGRAISDGGVVPAGTDRRSVEHRGDSAGPTLKKNGSIEGAS